MKAWRRSAPSAPLETGVTRIGVIPVRAVALGLGGGTLFSAAQATMQAPQPVQRSISMTIPYRRLFISVSLPDAHADWIPGTAWRRAAGARADPIRQPRTRNADWRPAPARL